MKILVLRAFERVILRIQHSLVNGQGELAKERKEYFAKKR